MGTITQRKRSDGTVGFTAQIRIKQNGETVFSQAQTFDRRQAAAAWLEKRETELALPGALQAANIKDPTLSEAIDRYIKEMAREPGRTKSQVLDKTKAFPIAAKRCSKIGSADIVEFAQSLLSGDDPEPKPIHGRLRKPSPRLPQTVGNYLSHLSSIFQIARPAWRYPLDAKAMEEALLVLQRLGVVKKSAKRARRPTLDELDLLMEHFGARKLAYPDACDMQKVIAFAIYSTRRLDEICHLTRSDLDRDAKTIVVRNMKHPDQKIGNDVRCELCDEALGIIAAMPDNAIIFPYNARSISTIFTRACKLLGIDDLHFHDLRHEGVSRLFEMGRTVPQAASVSGHRSWGSLQRYTHMKDKGDKFAGWKWLPVVQKKPA